MLKAALVAMSLAVAMPCFAEVRVITGDVEHVYGPGGKVLDDADLQARNQRAWEHVQAEKQLEIERRQLKIERERLKLQQAAIAYGIAQDWDGTAQGWNSIDGGWFVGSTRGIAPRKGLSHRIGSSPRIGISRRR
jgi:hypothetical protein